MSRSKSRSRSAKNRTNLYEEITTKIIGELEAGHVPWVQPWGTAAAKAPLAMPNNAATGRGYSGINVLIPWGAVIEKDFPGQIWLTYRQAQSLGGNVRKGEHGTTIVYAFLFIPNDEKKRARETGDDPQAIPFLKRFTVFNAAQCESLPEDVAVAAPHRLDRDLSGSFGSQKYAFEELVAEMNAAFCCASLGIVPTVRHADYIGSWLKVLKEDNRTIVRAASKASMAAEYLLGFLPEDMPPDLVAATKFDRSVA